MARTKTLLSAALLAGLAPLLTACGDSAAESVTLGAAVQGAGPFGAPYKANAAQPTDPEAFLARLGLTTQQYDSARFDRQLGAIVVETLSFSLADGQAEAARAEFYAPDAAALGAIMEGGEGDLLSPFERLRLYGVVFRAEQEAETSTPTPAPPSAAPADDAEAGAELGAEMGAGSGAAGAAAGTAMVVEAAAEGVELVGPRLSPAFLGDVQGGGLDALAFDGATLIGATLQSAGEGADIDLSAARVEIGGYEGGRIGKVFARKGAFGGLGDEAAMVELAEGSPEFAALLNSPFSRFFFPASSRTTFEQLSWEGADLAGLLAVLRRGDAPVPDAEDLISIGGLTVKNAVSFIDGRQSSKTGSITVSPIPFIGLMPKRISVEVKDSVTDYTAFLGEDQNALRTILQERGLDSAEGRSAFDYRYAPETGEVSIESTTQTEDLADAALFLEIGGFDHAALANGDEAALRRVAIDRASIVLEDDNLLDAIFALSAAGSAQDADMLRQQAVGVVTLGALQGSQISPKIPQYAAALSAFLLDGGTLSVTLAPQSPVTIGILEDEAARDPAALIDRLGLSVERTD